MATIEQLIQKIQQLEDQLAQQTEKVDALMAKAREAVDFASHAYRVDHYGYIWVWDTATEDYKKSNMRICTPKIADMALQSRHIADKAVESRHIADRQILSRHIGDGEVKSRNIGDNQILSRHIGDGEVKSRNIGEKAITGDDFEGNIPNGKLADQAVNTRVIRDHNVTPEKLEPDLLNQIYSAAAHGYALSGLFGDSTLIGIHQKALTQAFDMVWQKLEEITGEVLRGFSMVVSPQHYIGEEGCSVHVSANTVATNGIFEHIAFYINGVLIHEADNAEYVEFDTEISETSVIMCKAKIMGIEYTRQKTVTHYSSFWLGAGAGYADIMNVSHVISITNGMRGAYDIEVSQGQHIIVVVGESLAQGFIRADINGSEIHFNQNTVTIDGNQYRVFTSANTYDAGTYNIDING